MRNFIRGLIVLPSTLLVFCGFYMFPNGAVYLAIAVGAMVAIAVFSALFVFALEAMIAGYEAFRWAIGLPVKFAPITKWLNRKFPIKRKSK